jgi:hypothetical protein
MTLDDFARALVAGARAFVEVAEDALGPPDSAVVVAIEPAQLLTKRVIAVRLGVSTATVDRYVAQGMPFEPFGTSKRFRYEDCEAWAKARPALRATPALAGVRCLSNGGKRDGKA